ncbi:MAG: hypothetical protein IJW47_01175 [Clostridia bacterium]|nr:hypothetical protein [Clostridia bacterium]
MLKTIILIAVLVVITVAFITFLVVGYKRLKRKEKAFFWEEKPKGKKPKVRK